MSTLVKEAFKDYKEQGDILDCLVININLYKKSSKVEVDLEADKQISLEDVYLFEDYLKRKFEVNKAIVHVKYAVGAGALTCPDTCGGDLTREANINDVQIYKPLIFGRTDKISRAFNAYPNNTQNASHFGSVIKDKIIPITELSLDYAKVAIEGKVVSTDYREIKGSKILAAFNIYDGTSTVTCKAFLEKEKAQYILERIAESKKLRIAGNLQYDNYSKDLTIIANTIIEIPESDTNARKDSAGQKRVELHMHTQMSQLDGVSSAAKLIKKAASWGMKAIAVTDHGSCQAFPEANKASGDLDIKVIYGVEAYLVPDYKERQ